MISASARRANGAPAPSDRIALGLIGAGNICTGHREAFLGHKDCGIVAVCDPVDSRRLPFKERINAFYGSAVCTDYRDFRDMLARPDIDAVCIGVSDHWHAIIALRAMQAGKDVYVEKPLTRTIVEVVLSGRLQIMAAFFRPAFSAAAASRTAASANWSATSGSGA